jgi:hypothetical protein
MIVIGKSRETPTESDHDHGNRGGAAVIKRGFVRRFVPKSPLDHGRGGEGVRAAG